MSVHDLKSYRNKKITKANVLSPIFSKAIIEKIISKCTNGQDAVIISLLFFEGAYGEDATELRNLKMSDVNYSKNEITLTNERDEKRTVNVSNQSLALIKRALEETEYIKRNGIPNERGMEKTALISTDYVIRPAKTKVSVAGPVNSHIIYGRLMMLGDPDILNIPHLKIQNLRQSGMLHMAREIYERDGDFSTKEQIEEICKKFNVKKRNSQDEMEYDWESLAHLKTMVKTYRL
ncbi:hypothetical protein ACFVS2_25930 [Brevibacillus sp. NPDC058079]|uniref:phage lytic cycle repressor MrpR family protein n=1 Tax=Brevibacillus sp. NPDC058079 TaxID=3346330 RepID=UPI0036E213EC